MNKAQDLTQEAFIKLWQNCAKVTIPKAKTYLYTIGKRLFLNEIKHQNVVLKFEKNSVQRNEQEDPEYLLEQQEFKSKLEQAIANLSEKEREVFLMAKIENLSYKEIAERIDISVKGVEKRMSNALRNLKNQVQELKRYKI